MSELLDPATKVGALTPEQRKLLAFKLGLTHLNGRALVAEALRQCGIRRLIGICGTPIDAIFGEVHKRGIRCISTRHQASATLMAAGANFLAGSVENVVLVSCGPALTNTISGILAARDNQWPLVVMGGRRSLRNEGAGYFQELDAVPIMAPITKWASTIRQASEVIPVIHRAIEVALSGTPGPVYLDLPEDVLSDNAAPLKLGRPTREPHACAGQDEVQRAFELLRASERPVLCLGEGIRWNYDVSTLQDFVEREQLPVISTSLGRGFLPDSHPLCFNSIRHFVQPGSDLVLMAGAWFDWRFRNGAEVAPDARVIHIDPDDRVRGRNVRLTQSVAGDPGDFLLRLEQLSRNAHPVARSGWIEELSKLREAKAFRNPDDDSKGIIGPYQLHSTLKAIFPPDTVLIVEGGVHLACGQYVHEVNRPLSWFDPGWNGFIGCGIPLAMAARLAYPDRPVVAVVGDTGFGMTGMELETAARHNLPIIVVVVNNNGVNGIRRQKLYIGDDGAERCFAFQDDLRYDLIGTVLGARGAWVTDIEELVYAVDSALRRRDLTCINVSVDPNVPAPIAW